MSPDLKVDQFERLVSGSDFGSNRIELLKLCFPWMKTISFYPTEEGVAKCVVECKSGRNTVEAESWNLSQAISYLIGCSLEFEVLEDHGVWGGNTMTYVVKSGLPWIEVSVNGNVPIPEDNPKSLYHGGPL